MFVIQLKGLEHWLERAVTEYLLWNLIGFIEAVGPGPRRCFVVLDEAHKLALVPGSPAEKLLRGGRKFGLGLILASPTTESPNMWRSKPCFRKKTFDGRYMPAAWCL